MIKSPYNREPEHFISKEKIPVFAAQDFEVNEFSIQNAAQIHDNAMSWLCKTHNVDEAALRVDLISRLRLKPGQTILMTATGAGNDLPELTKCLGSNGKIYAQDFAKEMLLAAASRANDVFNMHGCAVEFSVSDATDLPFESGSFDAVYHFGGINLYDDIPAGIREMDRVAKPGARVVIGDEGIAPWLLNTDLAQALITNNALYTLQPPMGSIPQTAKDVNLSWVVNNCFYIIEFTAGDRNWSADIDVNHVGRRGGSIRSRHYGKLEGVSPDLRDRFYELAERKGKSRTDYLETLISNELAAELETE